MKMLTAEITRLLDKLYNLRGEDSVILNKMEEERLKAAETKERTAKEKTNLQEQIANLTDEERLLKEEGDKLLSALRNINGDDFKFVLEKLHISFSPEKLSEEVSKELPTTIEGVREGIESAKKELVTVETEMDTAVATIEELAIRKDEALANQERLNEYFELALNGNINITRDSITSLLEKFEFTEDEQREAAKILMFPEDALYDYENKIKGMSQANKTINEVIDEVKEEPKLSPKEELIKLLNDLGFDHLDFTSSDIDKILANYNEDTLRKNVMFMSSKGVKLDIFVDNAALLYDKELEEKVSELLNVGKETFDIYLNPGILIKYSKEDLENTINNLRSSGLDPKQVPLIAY